MEHAQYEGEGRHDDGPKSQTRGIQRRIVGAQALAMALRCEFNDENGVLCGEADERH